MSLNGLVTTAWLIPLYALVAWAGALIWSPGITRRTGPRPAGYLNALRTQIQPGSQGNACQAGSRHYPNRDLFQSGNQT